MTSALVPQAPAHRQLTLDELGEPLHATTFVVVDLETTGGSAQADGITEIGAVKVCGGEVLGEFQTLVNSGVSITPFVSVLTGITDSMVVAAPGVGAAVPAFLEFARGAVLVAHNAPFDIGFLKAACLELQLPWPSFAVVDTAVLARRVLTRDEVPNCKLSTLAPFFHATTTPTHRALDDARATVDVLHGLIARLGSLGVHSLPELRAFTAQVSDAQRRKRHLADGMPAAPGVYIFRDAQGRPLYVGTSRNLRTRVRQYFMASETRTRMGEMIGLAERVDPIECAHALEAQVRELRLIAAHKPRYNRRSKFPERSVWLKLTVEPFPRLSIVRDVKADGASYLGPLRNQRQAEAVRDAIHDAVPLRQCSDRLSLRRVVRAACVLAGIGRCAAPCEGGTDPARYDAMVRLVASAWAGDVRPLVEPLEQRGWPRCRPRSATSTPAWCATASPPSSGPAPACSGSPRCVRSRSWWRPGPTATAGGSCRWCGPGGWPRPGGRRAACRPGRWSRRCAPPPTSSTSPTSRWPRRPSASCAGWKSRARASSTPRTRGSCRPSAPAACGPTSRRGHAMPPSPSPTAGGCRCSPGPPAPRPDRT